MLVWPTSLSFQCVLVKQYAHLQYDDIVMWSSSDLTFCITYLLAQTSDIFMAIV